MADNNLKNIDDVLNVLNQINIDHSTEVYIPSLSKSIKFKPLTEKNQTAIMNVFTTSPIFNNDFNILFFKIIKELAVDPCNFEKLTIIDKNAIAVQLKIANQGPKYTSDEGVEYDLALLKESLKSISGIPAEETITIDEFSVTIGIPTLKEELEFDAVLSEKIKTLSLNDEKPYRALLSEILFYMFLQYIKNVAINRNESIQTFDFNSFNSVQKRKIGEALPSKIFDEINLLIDSKFAPTIQKTLQIEENVFVEFSPKLFLKK